MIFWRPSQVLLSQILICLSLYPLFLIHKYHSFPLTWQIPLTLTIITHCMSLEMYYTEYLSLNTHYVNMVLVPEEVFFYMNKKQEKKKNTTDQLYLDPFCNVNLWGWIECPITLHKIQVSLQYIVYDRIEKFKPLVKV